MLQPLLINRSDFDNYLRISSNTKLEKLNVYIFQSQDIELRAVLGDEEYEEMMKLFSLSYEIEAITVEATTQIETKQPHGYNVGDFVELSGLTGTVETLNNKRYRIADIIDTTNFTIDEETTSLVYAESGLVYRGLEARYEELCSKPFFRAFLVFASYVRYLGSNALHDTNSGTVEKILEQSQRPSNMKMGAYINANEQNRDEYKERLVHYLIENKQTYKFFADSIQENDLDHQPRIIAVRPKPEYRRQFDFNISRRR
ncbi:MAG: hypothetical protein ACFB0B_15355 [Thermonemataceae bacterium]